MFETILKLYCMYMATGVTSPLPHLFGPPGCGKSTVVQQLADHVGKKCHVLNVARLSPLEVEGMQMPVTEEVNEETQQKLIQLIATYWSQLNEGDILLLDEFLRGFPEVYNGLLDIITSRIVAWYKLPRVFIIAASNSTVAYDKALEDRLLHIKVPNPQTSKQAKQHLADQLVNNLGLLPEMRDSYEMTTLLDTQVLPMFDILKELGNNRSSSPATLRGCSIRNLIGQATLRHVDSSDLAELLKQNNNKAVRDGKWQYVFLVDGKEAANYPAYTERAQALPADRLTEIQRINRDLNLQLIEMEQIRNEQEGTSDDNPVAFDDAIFS